MMPISSGGSMSVTTTNSGSFKVKEGGAKNPGIGQRFKAIFSKSSTSFPNIVSIYSMTGTPSQVALTVSMGPTIPVSFQKKSADDMDKKDREVLVLDANIAAFPYHQSLEKIGDKKQSWDLARPLALSAGKSAGLSTKGSKGFIYDKKSGLTAYILHNPRTKEVRLVLGGTSAGKHAGGMVKRSFLNGPLAIKQWMANAKNALLNETPKSYTQAKELTTALKKEMDSDPKYNGYTLKLSGHSKGAGEASYASLSQETPLQTICFSSAQLGSKTASKISDENKAKAPEYIQHYAIKGDPVPRMDMLQKHLGHLGTLTMIPSKSAMSSPIDRHDKFHQHISSFAKLK